MRGEMREVVEGQEGQKLSANLVDIWLPWRAPARAHAEVHGEL